MSRKSHEGARGARTLPIHGSAGEACASGSCGCSSAGGAIDPSSADGNGTSRRDFLKVLGVGGAGAAAIGCGPPDFADTLITQLVQPEEIVPGRNDTYATALGEAGPEPLGIHATVRDGRVIKLEGNPSFPTNEGRLSGLAQSVLQDLYDPDRIPNPRRRLGDAPVGAPEDAPGETAAGGAYEDVDWDAALAATAAALGQGSAVLLTGGVTGTSARFFAEWAAATGAEHVAYEPFEYGALRAAHEIAFGTAAIPTYALDRADRIVSFGADFLGTWLAPVELAGRYARARAIDEGRHAKFTFVGPRLSVTGSNADEWLSVRAGTEGLVALAVAHDVAGRRGVVELAAVLAPYAPEAVAETAGVPAERIERLAEELAQADAPVALPPGIEGQGPQATEAHLAVALLNHACGAIGRTVELTDTPVRPSTASFDEMRELIDRMNRGQVRTLLVSGTNPVFALPRSAGFAEALANVPNVIAIHPHLDETAAAAGWLLPCHHALESWGDVEARPGVRALAQPVMRPVFDTRPREDILLQIATIAGRADGFETETFADYLKEAWRELLGVDADAEDDWWLGALRGGGTHALELAASDAQAQQPTPAPALTTAAQSYLFGAFEPPTGDALLVYPSVHFYDGRGANRAWMQEVPDPVTRNVWNSWVELHPDMAERLGVEHGDVVAVRSEAGSLEAPVSVNRGIRSDTVAIPIGQGHTHYGRNAAGRGVNPLDLLPPVRDPVSGALAFAGVSVSVEPTGQRAPLVSTQGSDSDLGREIAELLNVDEAREAIEAHAAESVDTSEPHVLAWDTDPQSPYRWAMTIDLNSCTGCGACVTACYAENNIHTVGEVQVAARREMSWLRVYRFYEETEDDGFQVVHTPMLCQHCGDAPCEPVCPVYATYHNPEGLNVQVYNRCVGTRYCANNCPFKVRRFNWFDYEHPYPLNLQLNPDVTVRQKGVMEKCTFCVQRINRARVDAKDEGRFVEDGEVVTACQQGCPTQAITFGNLKDPNSRVSQIARSARAYQALSELGVRPAITYLKGVTHAEPAREEHGHGGEYEGGDAGAEHGADERGEGDH